MKTKNNLMAALAAGLFITCVTFTSCTSDIGDNPVIVVNSPTITIQPISVTYTID